jgi:hypothetical protein
MESCARRGRSAFAKRSDSVRVRRASGYPYPRSTKGCSVVFKQLVIRPFLADFDLRGRPSVYKTAALPIELRRRLPEGSSSQFQGRSESNCGRASTNPKASLSGKRLLRDGTASSTTPCGGQCSFSRDDSRARADSVQPFADEDPTHTQPMPRSHQRGDLPQP